MVTSRIRASHWRKSGTTVALAAVLALGVASAQAQDILLKPFVVDHFARTDSEADVRFLLDGPAGKYGHVQVRDDGHLYFANGQRFRCWGVNMTGWTPGSSEIPPKEEAKIFASEMGRLGINCVRLHFLDMPDKTRLRSDKGPTGDMEPETHTPVGLIDSSRDDTSQFNPEQLDRLDYFFNELKANGIYVDFNLNVGHTWKTGDGIPDADLIGVAKTYTYFGPEIIEKQKQYAKMLLGHLNPYTGLRYADDPAVMTVELVNENSVLEFWMRNWFRGDLTKDVTRHQLDLTPHYKALLTKLYNDWLTANCKPAELAKIRKGANIADGQPVPILQRAEFADAQKDRFYAEAEFYTHLETQFFEDMRDYLRKDLGVKAPIVGSADHTYFIPGQPHLRSTSKMDIIDAHVYWQHPAIYGKRNTPMVNDPMGSIIQKLSRTPMLNRPFTVSEVNEPFPAEYDSEQIPILAAYAALQDWDGIFFYTFETKLKGEWKGMVGDHFDMTQHPSKMAQMPVGAMIFLRGDVAAAKKTVTRSYSSDQINEMIRMEATELPAYTKGYPAALPLVHNTRISCLDCAPTEAKLEPVTGPITSDTGELVWRTKDGEDGLVSIDTPRSQALVGFIPANDKVHTHNLDAEIANPFAVITLSSLDGKPISMSNLMLLTTTSKVENTGAEWNVRRTAMSKWGEAPSLIEPVTGWIQLNNLIGSVDVTAIPLDGAAKPLGEIKGRLLETGWEIEIGQIPTTIYLVHVYR
jgi:hypothetical protein